MLQQQFNPFCIQRLKRDGRPPQDGDRTPTTAIDLIGAFDDMGSSEFEWGAVPEAVNRMVEVGSTLRMALRPVMVNKPELWSSHTDNLGQAWADAPAQLQVNVYVIAAPDKLEQVFRWIQAVDAQQEHSGLLAKTYFLQQAYLQTWNSDKTLLEGAEDRFTGWFDICEDFFYFTSREQCLAVFHILTHPPKS